MEASAYEAGSPSHPDAGEDVYIDHREGEENDDKSELSDQIGRALENFAPFITRKLNETLEGAMSVHLATRIREEVSLAVQEEFNKRFPTDKETEILTQPNPNNANPPPPPPRMFEYKNFSVANPPEYHGDSDPIIINRWISEVEGAFRITQCPQELKVTYGVSMLRGRAKQWWDDQLTVKGEGVMYANSWVEFKALFLKEFRPESEVTRLRGEFLNTGQGSWSINEFRAKFLDKAQFCPEYLGNDTLLKEHFYRKMRKNLRERIS